MRQEITRRFALLLAVGMGALPCGPGACGREDREPPPRPEALPPADPAPRLARDRLEAGRAGVEWLIDHADEVPPGWSYLFYVWLLRIVEEERWVAEIEAILRQNLASGRHVPLPDELSETVVLRPARLIRILAELLRRKQVGLPHDHVAGMIQARIDKDEETFWRPVPLSQRLVYLYVFDELGIDSRLRYADVRQRIRATLERGDPEVLARSKPFVYAITHLVLNRSRYYRKRVDAAEIAFALPLLRRSLRHLAEAEDDEALDLQAEILGVYQLIDKPYDAVALDALADLVAQQNPDGSWGRSPGTGRGKFHLVGNAVTATLVLPEALGASRGTP